MLNKTDRITWPFFQILLRLQFGQSLIYKLQLHTGIIINIIIISKYFYEKNPLQTTNINGNFNMSKNEFFLISGKNIY